MRHATKIFGILSLFIFLLVGVHAIEPEWKYKTEHGIEAISITPDGKYIVAGDEYDSDGDGWIDSGKIYLFDNSSNKSLWGYEVGIVDYLYITPDDSHIIVKSRHYDKNEDKFYWRLFKTVSGFN